MIGKEKWVDSYAPELVPICYSAVKHGYRWFISEIQNAVVFSSLYAIVHVCRVDIDVHACFHLKP